MMGLARVDLLVKPLAFIASLVAETGKFLVALELFVARVVSCHGSRVCV